MIVRSSSALAAVVLFAFNLPLAAAQTMVIAAPPVTTAPSGEGTIQYTVSGIPFNGQLIVGCQYAGQESFQSQFRLPVCGAGPVLSMTVTAGQTVTKTISLIPWGSPIPASAHRAHNSVPPVLVSGFLLAGALLLGFGRRRRRWPSLPLIAIGALVVASSLSACGGSSIPPAGTYPYTLVASLAVTPSVASITTSATVNVTIP